VQENQTEKNAGKKAGFVAVIGRPSAGKSTLVNALCGEKVSIVSATPQTTRDAIRGIVNREQGQLVLVDTPGRYKSEKKDNKKLREISDNASDDADAILYVIDATRPPGEEEADIAASLAPLGERTVAAINKIDDPAADAGAARAFLAETIPALDEARIIEVSAKTGQNIEALIPALFDLAGEGEPFYGAEFYTDQEVDFRISEIIREQAINRLKEEIPHAIRVEVADAQFVPPPAGAPEPARRKLWARAFITVERESQKGIVVGKGGAMIKAIRLASLRELARVFDWKIELDLRVKVAQGRARKNH